MAATNIIHAHVGSQPKWNVPFEISSTLPDSRPLSQLSEYPVTEFEDDDSDNDQVYRHPSFQSFDNRRRSDTTVSSYDEAITPNTESGQFHAVIKPVEGPQGPHLFRLSQSSADYLSDVTLQLSPLETKHPKTAHSTSQPASRSRATPLPVHPSIPGMPQNLRDWSCNDVLDWMYSAGIELSLITCFEENDITGAVLVDMTFEDLKDLGVKSFGKRHQLWSSISALKGGNASPSPGLPPPHSVIDNIRRPETAPPSSDTTSARFGVLQKELPPTPPHSTPPDHERQTPPNVDLIKSIELRDCVGIEYTLPKEHKCSKGQACKSWQRWNKKAKRAREFSAELNRQLPNLTPTHKSVEHLAVPNHLVAQSTPLSSPAFHEGVPSIAASSDVLGPDQLPKMALQKANVDKLNDEKRDRFDPVKQYLQFQHVLGPTAAYKRNGSPPPVDNTDRPRRQDSCAPLRLPESTPAPHGLLRRMPRLTIPGRLAESTTQDVSPTSATSTLKADTAVAWQTPQDTTPVQRAATAVPFLTPMADHASPQTALPVRPSTALPSMRHMQSPLSATPTRASPLGPGSPSQRVASPVTFHQDHHASAPTLHHRTLSHSSSRTCLRRPSLPVLAEEGLFPSPRRNTEPTIPSTQELYGESCTKAGTMRKRHRTRLVFTHDWSPAHFRLHGTRLAMHASPRAAAEKVAEIDVHEYTVNCEEGMSGGGGLKGALLNKVRGGTKPEPGAFAFQLVPETRTGKTHHFSVDGRGERMDWVREVMLAKAKGLGDRGFAVRHNI